MDTSPVISKSEHQKTNARLERLCSLPGGYEAGSTGKGVRQRKKGG